MAIKLEKKNSKKTSNRIKILRKNKISINNNNDKKFMMCKNGKYIGFFVNEKKNGQGRMIYNNGDMYEGNWNNNKKSGFGKIIYNNGDIYEGEWENNKKDGNGKMKYKNGDICEGVWKNDILCEKKIFLRDRTIIETFYNLYEDNKIENKITSPNGDIYNGDVKDNTKHGKGGMNYSNGDYYKGEWKDDNRDGYGKCIYKNGDIYEGMWKNDKQNGKGKYIHYKDKTIEAEFENNKNVGFTKVTFLDGDIFEGNIKDGKASGFGKKYYAEKKETYEGNWKNDKRNGFGKCFYSNGDIYEGEFENNSKHGSGKIIYKNEDIYEGEFKNNKKEKFGILKSKNEIHIQKWENDIFVDSISFDITKFSHFNPSQINFAEINKLLHKDLFDDDRNYEIRCPISFEYLYNPIITNCDHVFNKDSIEKIINSDRNSNRNCPICRTPIDIFYNFKLQGEFNIANDILKYMKFINVEYKDNIYFEFITKINKSKEENKKNIRKKEFPNGDIYEGIIGNISDSSSDSEQESEEESNNNKNGYGKLTYINGDYHEGVWKRNSKNDIFLFYSKKYDTLTLQKWNNNKFIDIIDLSFDIQNTSICKKSNIKIRHNLMNLICPITNEIMNEPIVLQCGHRFCKNNIRRFKSCPECNEEIIYYKDDIEKIEILQKVK
jgi:hypothetical protein